MHTLSETEYKTLEAVHPEAHVYVHVEFGANQQPMLARIWPTTFLVDTASSHRSVLVHAENITYAPAWTPIPPGKLYRFLLVFSGLPASCLTFDLIEEAGGDEGGAFVVRNIARNPADVYRVRLY